MKIKYFLVSLFLCFTNASFSQILVGPTAGVNYSWVSFGEKESREIYSVKPVIGFNVGFQASFKVRKRFFLNTSLLYSQKGKLVEGKIGDITNKVRYDFIDLPITYTIEFKNTIGRNKEFKWYLGLGPNVSYWLGGKGTLKSYDPNDQLVSQSYTIVFDKYNDEKGNFDGLNEMDVKSPNRLQLGLNVTAGIALEPSGSNQKILLTLRYEIGHSYLSKDGRGIFDYSTLYEDDLKARNQGFRLSIAYLFDLRTDQRKRGKSTFDKKRKSL